MSTRGVYAALSGSLAQAQRLDTIANNLANVNTPGFKRDEQTFREYLSANEKPSEVLQVAVFQDLRAFPKTTHPSIGTTRPRV